MAKKENINSYKLDIELIRPCHWAYTKIHNNQRKQLLALIKNINMNRTACAVHKALSRDISRLSADETMYRASRCGWADRWKIIEAGNPAFLVSTWRNPRVSRGQQDKIWDALPEELRLIARKL